MRTVLHLGAHKTGTSLIQKYYRDNDEDMRALGVNTVSRSETDELIGWGRALHREPDKLRGRLLEAREQGWQHTLVSHENSLGAPFAEDGPGLYPAAAKLADRLRRACRDFDVRVCFYVRPLAAFVESYYLQTIHQGRWHRFDEWVETVDLAAVRWGPVVDALDEVFGEANVAVGDFDEIRDGQEAFLHRFVSRCGLPEPQKVAYRPVRNPSVSSLGLRIAYDVNPLLESPAERRLTRRFLQRHFSNRDGDRARPMPDDVRSLLDAADAEEYPRLRARALASLAESAT